MCTTTTHYETHISAECSLGGSGQCDSTCIEHKHHCTCSCHWTMADIGQTTDEVRAWHDETEGVVASFPIAYPEGEDEKYAAWMLAQAEADKRNAKPVDGTLYQPHPGQGRVVVVWKGA
jgi:hypothetical protein